MPPRVDSARAGRARPRRDRRVGRARARAVGGRAPGRDRRRRARATRARRSISCTSCGRRGRPVVIDLRVPREALSTPERDDRPAYELTPAFDFARERCYFLARANNYDARDGSPRWGAAAEARAARCAHRAGPPTCCSPTARRCGATAARARSGLGRSTTPRRASLRDRVGSAARRPRTGRQRGAATGLAPDQRAAVLHAGGPARILAPAGSGKTTVLAARFRHLVVERGYGADERVRARVQPAGRRRDAGPARRPARPTRGARSARSTRSATTSCGAPAPTSA